MSTPEEQVAAQAAEDAAAVARGDVIIDDAAKLEAEKAAAAAKLDAAAEDKSADELANGEEGEEETPEEKVEREAEEAKAASAKRARIPLARHEEILAKARQREEALTRRLQEIESKPPEPRRDAMADMKAEISTLQDKYEELLFEGKKDEATVVRREMDAKRDQYMDAKTAATGELARNQTIEHLRYESTLAKAEADYPALNPDNEAAFDDAKANEVATLMNMFIGNGLTRPSALEKAIKYVMGSPTEKVVDNTAETLRAKREREAREKAVATQRQQPPNTNITGTDNDKAGSRDPSGVDVMKMSQEQFAKLDEDALARARGDIL